MTSAVQVPILCVDCDGTLIKGDLLYEAMLQLAKRRFWLLLAMPFWLLGGLPRLKLKVALHTQELFESPQYNSEFLEFLHDQHRSGRRLALITGAPLLLANAVARELGVFSEVYASTPEHNLVGIRRRDLLLDTYGQGNFEYAGNSASDLPIWRVASAAIIVNAPAALTASVQGVATVSRVFARPALGIRTVLRALRVHQWVKNLLIFVPLVVSHRIAEPGLAVAAGMAFVCFSLCASAVYICNDLLDLRSDRLHPRKRSRPFASGELSIPQGVALALACLAASLAIAFTLPMLFLLTLACYFVATTAYSFALKNRAVVDVLLLAGLYTIRIIAGAAATLIVPSFWLLALAMFLFLSLAIVKRYAELLVMVGDGKTGIHGRGYLAGDLPLLLALGAASGMGAVFVLALYINTPEVDLLYSHPQVLWLIPPLLLFWICRVWMKTHRGQMYDDPIVFAFRDRVSLLTGGAAAALLLLATYLQG